MAPKKKLTFEERLAQVEALIGEMEGGTLPLEEALRQYEEGMKALAALEKELQSAQQKLTVLRRAADGTEEETPLEVEE
ncbi:MAG: exodeoxyribonuclease VII small subunit [Clostridia bacterium]|nr:exodeoxyribonuclease VII small subunit [Clostridia bacterium]